MNLHFLRRGAVLVAALVVALAFVVVSGPFGTAGEGPKPTPTGYDVLFVRHAASDSSAANPDLPLNATGLSQAAALAALLHDDPVNAVDSSMLLRAFQTGTFVATDHDLPVVADARINEVTFDASLSGSQIFQILGSWLHGQDRDQGFGGESFNDVASRWTAWWASFVADHHTDKGEAVVVSHGAILLLMLPQICTNPVDPDFVLSHGLPNTGIIKTQLHPNGTLSCTEWAGTPIPSALATSPPR